jgi:hypothetical protein
MLRAIKAAPLAVMTVFRFGFSLTTITPTHVLPDQWTILELARFVAA